MKKNTTIQREKTIEAISVLTSVTNQLAHKIRSTVLNSVHIGHGWPYIDNECFCFNFGLILFLLMATTTAAAAAAAAMTIWTDMLVFPLWRHRTYCRR